MEEEDERKQPHDPLFGKNPVGAREDKLLADGVGVGVGGEEVATTLLTTIKTTQRQRQRQQQQCVG